MMARRIFSLPPCGGGSGWGVGVFGAFVSQTPTPTPDPSPQGGGEVLGAGSRTQPHATICLGIALFTLASLLSAPAADAAETVIAGGVSSGSTNLWPIHIGIRKGFFQAADIKVDLVFAQS